jgi:hypothetical protein
MNRDAAPELARGWGDEEAEADSPSLDWLPIPAAEETLITLLSDLPARYVGHWQPSRRVMRRCSLPAHCPFCFAGLGKQRRFVVAVLDERRRIWLWEFGDAVAAQVRARAADNLRGLKLTLGRSGATLRAPVAVLAWEQTDGADLPPEPDAAGFLAAQWMRQALKDGKGPAQAGPSSSTPKQTPPSAPVSGRPPQDFKTAHAWLRSQDAKR